MSVSQSKNLGSSSNLGTFSKIDDGVFSRTVTQKLTSNGVRISYNNPKKKKTYKRLIIEPWQMLMSVHLFPGPMQPWTRGLTLQSINWMWIWMVLIKFYSETKIHFSRCIPCVPMIQIWWYASHRTYELDRRIYDIYRSN